MKHIHYPRTEHFTGQIFSPEHTFVIEEKMDGIGLGLGFHNGKAYIQQRGHIYLLNDIPHLLKGFVAWILDREELLYELIGENYVMFGEWLEYKHTHFYDKLPDYFLEYDVYSKEKECFLSTLARQQLIGHNQSWLHSVFVIDIFNQNVSHTILNNINNVFLDKKMLDNPQSFFKTDDILLNFYRSQKYMKNLESIARHTILDTSYEGFYIKLEDKDFVVSRYKLINKVFLQKIQNGEHWKNSSLVKNLIINV